MRESEAAAIFAQMGDSVSFPMEHAFDADDCSCAVCIAAGAAGGPSANHRLIPSPVPAVIL